jgi:hypothetical protein
MSFSNMKLIVLSRGLAAKVSDHRYEALNKWKWYALNAGRAFYAARDVKILGKKVTLLMHRIVAGAVEGEQVDHINLDTLDNQDENLRIADKSENMRNRNLQRNNKSGYKGVRRKKGSHRWLSRLKMRGREIHLGYFDTAEEAARAYDEAAKVHHGRFARLNFP